MSKCGDRSAKPAQLFQAGDRVRDLDGNDWTIVRTFDGDGRVTLWDDAGQAGFKHTKDLALVSRAVYAEPGQIVVLLDEADVSALQTLYDDNATYPTLIRVRAILDRAREAHRG